MNEKDFYKLLESLKNTLKCPLCGQSYENHDVKFLGTFNTAHLLEMTCKHCDLTVMATVIVGHGKNKIELLRSEMKKFGAAPDISSDELIELHKFFKKFNGDFRKLFRV
jgi:predicted nucleic-acid-binding Zn-ribbon protein